MSNKGLLLAPIFCDSMILQREKEICIYGTDIEAEIVTILFLDKEYSARVEENGDFTIKLPPNRAGGPYQLTVIGSQTLIISDILFGDVYLLGGQSNMELPLRRVMDISAEEIYQTKEPEIRQYVIPASYQFAGPSKYMHDSSWKKAEKDDLMGLSAAGYFFAKELKDTYQVPIGLILTAVGGSTIEAWMSPEDVGELSDKYSMIKDFYKLDYFHEYIIQQQDLSNKWLVKLEDEEVKVTEKEDFKTWKTCQVPSLVSDYFNTSFQGSVYLYKEIFLDEEPKESISIYMGTIIDSDRIWINGKLIGETGYRYPPRKYPIAAGVLHKGRNLILIRIIINNGNGGTIKGRPYYLSFNQKRVNLAGEWQYKIGITAQEPMPEILYPTRLPTGLYHTAIVPLSKISFKGMLWYQGESNTFAPEEYGDKFAKLLNTMRKLFGYDIPCIYVQLPNYQEPLDNRKDSGWAELRHQQGLNLSLKKVAMVVTLDIGEANDLHPQNKKVLGMRLAKAARYLIYQENKTEFSGPICKKGIAKDHEILLEFSHLENFEEEMLLNNFEIAESNQIFYQAKAVRKGKYVILTSDEVLHPVTVRYAWSDNPMDLNFCNHVGLPAAGFRMDLYSKNDTF